MTAGSRSSSCDAAMFEKRKTRHVTTLATTPAPPMSYCPPASLPLGIKWKMEKAAAPRTFQRSSSSTSSSSFSFPLSPIKAPDSEVQLELSHRIFHAVNNNNNNIHKQQQPARDPTKRSIGLSISPSSADTRSFLRYNLNQIVSLGLSLAFFFHVFTIWAQRWATYWDEKVKADDDERG